MSQALKRMQSVSFILMIVMLWQYGGGWIFAAARKPNSPPPAGSAPLPNALANHRFDTLLAELKEVIRYGSAKTKSAPEKGFSEIGKLLELKGKLIAENEKNQQQFRELESSLKQKGLTGEILNRHTQSVREYDAKYAVLMTRLESIESAQNQTTGLWAKLTGKSREVNWDGVLGATSKFLEANTPRPVASRVDPRNLPHSSLKTGKPIPPKLRREDWLKAFPKDSISSGPASARPTEARARTSTALFATTPPTPADLAETVEVKFTTEIQNLANSLDKNPVKIYNWVRNNIEFVPTWGSIQGAQLCLENRAGNAFDTASLLIALLRASGIPARYQMGTIEVPVNKFMNWAGGFTNVEAAASLFASAGVPSVVRRVNQSGQVVSVKLEHIWVQAFVDHAPSGGAVNLQGDAWVDLDSSFKQYSFPAPLNLSQFVRITNSQTFMNQVLAPATVNHNTGEVSNLPPDLVRSTFQPDEAAILHFLTANFPGRSMRENIGGGKIAFIEFPTLSGTLPNRVIVAGPGFAEIPDSLRHSMEITVADMAGNQFLSFRQSLPAFAGSSLNLGYTPAGEVDRHAIEALIPSDPQQPLPGTIPTVLINMKPELRINNQLVSSGNSARLGTTHSLRIRFSAPTIHTPSMVNSITVGEVVAIGLDLQQISTNALTNIEDRLREIADEVSTNPTEPNISPGEILDLQLSAVASGWFRQVDLVNRIAAQLFGVASLRYPSAGMAFSNLTTATLFGAPRQVTFSGLKMDIDRDMVVTVAKDGDSRAAAHHSLVLGMIGSGLEGSMPALFLHGVGATNTHWLATTSALAIAQDLGDTLVALGPANFPLVAPRLNLSNADLQDIQDALNAGLIVMVSEKQLRDRRGNRFLGYVQFDPSNGSGNYLIGGANGNEMADCLDNDLAGGLLGNIVKGGTFSTLKTAMKNYVNSYGGPGGLVGKILAYGKLSSDVAKGLTIYEAAVGAIGESAKPLIGLVVLLAGLSVLKEEAGLPFLTGLAAGAYLSVLAWAAYNLAIQIINRIVVIDAAALGHQIPPNCLTQ